MIVVETAQAAKNRLPFITVFGGNQHRKTVVRDHHMKPVDDRLDILEIRLREETRLLVDLEDKVRNLEADMKKMAKQYEENLTDMKKMTWQYEENLAGNELTKKMQIIQQLAYSYQTKLAEFVSVPNSKFSRTHSQVAKMKVVDKAALSQVESIFKNLSVEYQDSEDIDNGVKEVRELGSNLSRPSTNIDGTLITEDDIRTIVAELKNAKKLKESESSCALDVLEAVLYLCKSGKIQDTNIIAST